VVTFSPGTNMLIGSIGSGKSSCLDAICFALFGTFPALKSRRVSLEDTITALPGKEKGLVEITFTAGQTYTLTRTFSAKGTEAFLRGENGRLIEGPQPIRTTEAVCRALKMDYDLFTRVIYGEQNKLDYFLALGRGERKKQLDESLGIAAFETARANCSTVVSRLRGEKSAIDQLLAGIDFNAIETEVATLAREIGEMLQKHLYLSNLREKLTGEVLSLQKNVESMQETKKLAQELKTELVKLDAEAASLQSTANNVMPQSLAMLSLQECTAFLEECARALQERADIDREVTLQQATFDRLSKELSQLQRVIIEISPDELRKEIELLLPNEKLLEIAKAELLDFTKKLASNKKSISILEEDLGKIREENAKIMPQVSLIYALEKEFPTIAALEIIAAKQRQALIELERSKSAKMQAVETLQASCQLLTGSLALCPTCDQPLSTDATSRLREEKTALLEKEKNDLDKTTKLLASAVVELKIFERKLTSWMDLLPLKSRATELMERQIDLNKKLELSREELLVNSALLKKSEHVTSVLQEKVKLLEKFRVQIADADKKLEQLKMLEEESVELREALEKKQRALGALEPKVIIEEKLANARDGLKAFDMLEKQKAAVARGEEIRTKLSSISFNEETLTEYSSKFGSASVQLEGCMVSFEHITNTLREKKELLLKLEMQNSKFSDIRQTSVQLNNGVQYVQVFQNSIIETQAALRNELITAVNETMQELWIEVYPYRDYKGVRIVPTEDDYSLQLLDSANNWLPVERASGGEKTCASLCLRIALAMVLVPNLSWLVLDEPTHNLDNQAVSLLAKALHDTLPKIVKQTFVVTHNDALKEGASGAVHVFHRDKDSSAATVVETL